MEKSGVGTLSSGIPRGRADAAHEQEVLMTVFVVRAFSFGRFKGPVLAGPFATAADAFAAIPAVRQQFPAGAVTPFPQRVAA